MDKRIKESVGVLLAHIIKIDNREIEKEAPLFCKIMGEDFGCSEEEAKRILEKAMESDDNLDDHIEIINRALCEDKLSKYHLLEQLNHIIYSDRIGEEDYKIFEKVKERLFSC